jgi:hypothetical protein
METSDIGSEAREAAEQGGTTDPGEQSPETEGTTVDTGEPTETEADPPAPGEGLPDTGDADTGDAPDADDKTPPDE